MSVIRRPTWILILALLAAGGCWRGAFLEGVFLGDQDVEQACRELVRRDIPSTDQDSRLRLTVASVRDVFAVGDTMHLDLTIENISDGTIRLYHALEPERSTSYRVFDQDGALCFIAPQTVEPEKTLVQLAPGQKLTWMADAPIRDGRTYVFIGHDLSDVAEVAGIGIGFPDFSGRFLGKGTGTYYLQVHYGGAGSNILRFTLTDTHPH